MGERDPCCEPLPRKIRYMPFSTFIAIYFYCDAPNRAQNDFLASHLSSCFSLLLEDEGMNLLLIPFL